MRIDGRTVLLTGATGGIGHAIARQLRARGGSLVLTGRRVEVLEPLATEVHARMLAVDLADRAQLDRLLAEAASADILVANAALPGTGLLEELDLASIDRVLDVNLRAPMLLSRAAASGMRARGGGHIVLVGSLSGIAFSPNATPYCATKAGLRGFGLSLREELRDAGIGVSLIYPGPVSEAGMFADAGVDLPRGVGTSTPDEVAAGVVRAIERNRAEVKVAALPVRASIPLAQVAPGVNAFVQRHLGGNRTAAALARGQASKR